MDFYNKHSAMSVIVKKTEKITTAIYMVTDFISDSEPLRAQLRTLAISLVSGTRKLGARSNEPHYAFADELNRTIDETVVFINLAATVGLISDMNGKILRTELEKVHAAIGKYFGDKKVTVSTHPGYANIILDQSFFHVPESESVLPPKSYNGHVFDKGQIANQNPMPAKENAKSMGQIVPSKKSDIGIKIARRNDVLSVVRNKGKVSIKDIVSILKDTSEKTIQRELLALVREGVLIKEGEKRWSVYRVAA